MLELRKKGNKHWLLIDEEIGEFTPSKFTINRLNSKIEVVYFNNLKSKNYDVSDCYIFDIDETIGFNTSSGVEFMQKLEELNCPCFQKDVNNFYISGGSWSELTNFDALNDATLPLSGVEQIPIIQGGATKKVAVSEFQTDISGKLDKDTTAGVERAYIINADGSQGTKATSEFKDVLEFANLASLPVTGESGKIYLALDTNKTYRWSGSAYVQIGGGSQNLQQVTDLGNKTTNYIEVPMLRLKERALEVDLMASVLTETRELFAPDKNGTIATEEDTVAKVTTVGVERAYIINADGSQSAKATSEIGTTQNYFTFSTNTTLSNAHHNAVVWVTATINITIPSGLRSDFNCTFRTLTGAIATFLTSGTTINAESDGDVQAAKTMSFLAQYTTNNYIISGGGLS